MADFKYVIEFHTSDEPDANSTSRIHLTLLGTNGHQAFTIPERMAGFEEFPVELAGGATPGGAFSSIEITPSGRQPMDRGTNTTVVWETDTDLGDIEILHIGVGKGEDDWRPEKLVVSLLRADGQLVRRGEYPCNHWLSDSRGDRRRDKVLRRGRELVEYVLEFTAGTEDGAELDNDIQLVFHGEELTFDVMERRWEIGRGKTKRFPMWAPPVGTISKLEIRTPTVEAHTEPEDPNWQLARMSLSYFVGDEEIHVQVPVGHWLGTPPPS